ncbi:MAG: preprotein translocase subunit SecY [Deltaproteobacteria bacterium]|nr:preprotein translocase subunit SecY [Deltaproteobacteria bacterium]
MIGAFQDAAKIPELRRRVFFSLAMLIVYRIGVFVPTPGIDAEQLKNLFQRASGTLFGLANMFSGGALENSSVLALGIAPYISMSIIMQLLQASVPRLEALSKEGEHGRRVITTYTRIGTVILAMVQSLMISIGLESQGIAAHPGWSFRIITMCTLTAGSAFIMWLGEQITERGIGNGISLVISAGIIARMPSVMAGTLALTQTGELNPLSMLVLLIFALATIYLIVYVERAQRRIPIQYPKRALGGNRMTQATTQHLPLKLNTAGVIPPIFASSLLIVPATIAQVSNAEWLKGVVGFLTPATFGYELVFALLIVFFCYFYTALVFDPEKIAENLKKNGGFIPTVRPGKETSDFLYRVLNRLTIWGALYVCVICIVPTVFYSEMGAQSFTYFFGGTAVLIVVSVILDTVSQMQSHLVARNYEDFMTKSPGKMRAMARGGGPGRGKLIQR